MFLNYVWSGGFFGFFFFEVEAWAMDEEDVL
jgi:hypothetical protein